LGGGEMGFAFAVRNPAAQLRALHALLGIKE